MSQEVVHEFQVNRNSYNAEYGGATSSAIKYHYQVRHE
jgi:hypothetical protein